jgi:hypothetical protein
MKKRTPGKEGANEEGAVNRLIGLECWVKSTDSFWQLCW